MQGNYIAYETEELVVRYQSTQNEDYLQEILTRNKGLIHLMAFNYRNIPDYDLEDLEAEATIAIWRAVKNFNPSKGVRFTSFFKVYVNQHLNKIYNSQTRQKRYNGSTPESYEDLAEINREGFRVDDYTELEIREFIDTLAGTAKTVAVLLLTGYSKSDVARELKITPASTTYYIKKLKSFLCTCGEVALA